MALTSVHVCLTAASACTPSPATVARLVVWIDRSSHIFSGTVVEIADESIRFDVERMFKGTSDGLPQAKVLLVWNCGPYRPKVGERHIYFVVAAKDGPIIRRYMGATEPMVRRALDLLKLGGPTQR